MKTGPVNFEIIDPDGWNRSGDFYHSFFTEQVTWVEFIDRAMQSTIQPVERGENV